MRILILAPLLIVTGAVTALAASAATPAQPQESIPLVDELSRGIVCIDLEHADASRLLNLAAPAETMASYLRVSFVEELAQARSTLLAAGIRRVYLVFSLEDLPLRPWYLVAPCNGPVDAPALFAKLPNRTLRRLLSCDDLAAHSFTAEDATHWLFIGAEDAFQRAEKAKPSARPELKAALAESGTSTVRILLLPSDDDRRVIEELMPTLPGPLGGGSSSVLTRGLRWASVQLDLEPEPSVRMVIQSIDNEATERFCPLLVRALMAANEQKSRTDLMDLVVELAQVNELMPKVDGDRLVLNLRESDGTLAALHRITKRPLARLAIEQTAKDQLSRIVRAIHFWNDQHKSFPAQANYDANGKPLLSWRVHLLPFLGEPYAKLYGEFRIDEPWDSEHNLKMLQRMPEIYAIPGSKVAKDGRTCYVRPVGPGTSCPPDKSISFRDIADGTSNTVAVIEVDDEHSDPWTKPADLDYDPENPTKGLGGHLEGAVFSAFCDAAPHVHRKLIYDPKRIGDLRKVFTRADREPVNFAE
jgi:hypothetical protein